MQHKIIEIKAKCDSPEAVEHYLKENNAHFVGLDHQVDTYFKVPIGRLKLREGTIENHLIAYHRSNQADPKLSEVSLYKPNEAAALKIALANTIGIKVIVDKQRKIYFIENVKFHIDTVEGLGSFMEIEAIDPDGSFTVRQLQTQCDSYLTALNIDKKDLVAVSYSDLLLMRE